MEQRSRDLNRAVGRVVAKIRKERGLTQKQMWTGLNMSKNPYASLERGETNWTVNTLDKVCAMLEVDPSEVMRMAEKQADQNGGSGGPWMSALTGD